MQWIENNLVDDVSKCIVGYNKGGGECNDWAEVDVYDSKENRIEDEDLHNWVFIREEFEEVSEDDGEHTFPIKNVVTGEIGYVECRSSNNGYYSAGYWTSMDTPLEEMR